MFTLGSTGITTWGSHQVDHTSFFRVPSVPTCHHHGNRGAISSRIYAWMGNSFVTSCPFPKKYFVTGFATHVRQHKLLANSSCSSCVCLGMVFTFLSRSPRTCMCTWDVSVHVLVGRYLWSPRLVVAWPGGNRTRVHVFTIMSRRCYPHDVIVHVYVPRGTCTCTGTPSTPENLRSAK